MMTVIIVILNKDPTSLYFIYSLKMSSRYIIAYRFLLQIWTALATALGMKLTPSKKFNSTMQ
eukprot:snap_masked-scaffold_13-processed-gene-8.36-mRNA-1 protein AED:1.00 eAED:1.00 QI:0/0/0/0/1/1/2/0/61